MVLLMAIVGICLLVIYGSFSWGFVSWKFYGWFVLSTFEDAPQFSIIQFIGFMLFLSVIMPKSPAVHIKSEYKEDSVTQIGTSVVWPWVVLLLGWMMYSFFF